MVSNMNSTLFLIVTALITSSFKEVSAIFSCNSRIEITIPQGKIKGSCNWIKNYRAFSGIPYATVKERFQEPGAPLAWNGTFNANQGSIKCKQYFSLLGLPVGQEDCLTLNIFSPLYTDTKLYPVIVFIHGGGYYWGSNTDRIYNPRFLVKKNVTVVTVNYRLGAFGFLCLNHKEAPGNVGLKDQLAALKWIQNNIAYFDGDPKSVTLFGQSVGAASVNYLLLSHSAKGLFHRAIMDSGCIMMPQAFVYNPIESASLVASRLGYNTNNTEELLKILKNSSSDDIIKASYFDSSDNAFAPYVFKPCLEKAITKHIPLITAEPTDLIKNLGLNIPIIIGFNDKEGITWAGNYNSKGLERLDRDFTSVIPNYLLFTNENDKLSFIDSVKKEYFGNSSIDIDNLIDYFTDSVIAFPTVHISERLTNQNIAVYNYYFTYDSIRNLYKLISQLPKIPGANHADELFYLFDPLVYQVLPNFPKDMTVIELLTNLWTNFAKTGKPTNTKTSWPRSEGHLNFLELNSNAKMIDLPKADRMQFWREAFRKFGR